MKPKIDSYARLKSTVWERTMKYLPVTNNYITWITNYWYCSIKTFTSCFCYKFFDINFANFMSTRHYPNYQGSLIVISHDRAFLDEVTDRTLELKLGDLNSFKGNYSFYVKETDKRLEVLRKAYANQQKEIKEIKEWITRFRSNVKKASMVQSRIKALNKMELITIPRDEKKMFFRFPKAPPASAKVITITDLHKAYDENVIFNGLNLRIDKGDRIAVVGVNGAGKSVCMSTLILSLLYTFKPDELELVLIDPKRVEFGLFRTVPHLIHSVVADAKPAVQVLKWVVKEMERRYEVLAEKQVRNIAGYNEKAEAEGFKKMPFTVVIIDELADLMMTSKGEAEGALARIAQLSRAVGIHTIVATQRPSVNVITGIIKANFPTRIAFQVSSNVDSRTILDCKGAESLLGKGDFLFNPPGIARLIRIQSPMVQDHEIISIVEHISGQRLPEFRVDLKSIPASGEDQSGSQIGIDGIEGDDDEALLKKAMLTVAESQKASTSFLQRRLRIGYNRAALLIEELEDRMHIGPQNGSTPREVFITPEEVEWCK